MSSLSAVYHCALHNVQGSTGGRFSGAASAVAEFMIPNLRFFKIKI